MIVAAAAWQGMLERTAAAWPEAGPASTVNAASPRTTQPPVQKSKPDADGDVLVDLYQKRIILRPTSYPAIRHAFAGRFESEHQDAIRQAFGEKSSGFRRWLDEHADVKEEFYIAIDPAHDDVAKALALFRAIYDRFPQQLGDYANLAIAVSVVWDREDGAIHGSPVDSAVAPAHSFNWTASAIFSTTSRVRRKLTTAFAACPGSSWFLS